MEFEVGDYDIVAASNLAAVLATGDDSGSSYRNVFRNSAIQLYQLKEVEDRDVKPLADFAAQSNIDLLNVSAQDTELLKNNTRRVRTTTEAVGEAEGVEGVTEEETDFNTNEELDELVDDEESDEAESEVDSVDVSDSEEDDE